MTDDITKHKDWQAELTASRARISELESFKDDWQVMRDECDAAKLGFAVLLNENRDYELVITSLNARIAELKAAQRWLPIESAPKDTFILGFFQDNDPKFSVKICAYLGWDNPDIVPDWCDPKNDWPLDVQPSHWMPIPAPPTEKE